MMFNRYTAMQLPASETGEAPPLQVLQTTVERFTTVNSDSNNNNQHHQSPTCTTLSSLSSPGATTAAAPFDVETSSSSADDEGYHTTGSGGLDHPVRSSPPGPAVQQGSPSTSAVSGRVSAVAALFGAAAAERPPVKKPPPPKPAIKVRPPPSSAINKPPPSSAVVPPPTSQKPKPAVIGGPKPTVQPPFKAKISSPPPAVSVPRTANKFPETNVKAGPSAVTVVAAKPNLTKPSSANRATAQINSLADVTKDSLSRLSAVDVAQCAVLLGFDRRLADRLAADGLNGELLEAASADKLISKYSMTPLDANKFVRFARGWRPAD